MGKKKKSPEAKLATELVGRKLNHILFSRVLVFTWLYLGQTVLDYPSPNIQIITISLTISSTAQVKQTIKYFFPRH